MSDPFDARHSPPDPLEDELRRSLAAHGAQAPDASAVTERLLALGASGAAGTSDARRWRWSAVATPLVAAACVLAVVGIVLAVVGIGRHQHDGPDAVDSPTPPGPIATSTPSPAPTTAPTTPIPSSTAQAVTGSTGLRNLRVLDLTFTDQDSGWALGSADCVQGSGRCTALLRTTDGTRWTGHPNTPFTVPGDGSCPAATCVTHLRFADDSIGYAFGPHAFFMTTDGAQHWKPYAGGADALETVHDSVIRVSALDTDTPVLETSGLGATSWTKRSTAGFPSRPAAVSLNRTGSAAVLSFSYVTTPAAAAGAGVVLRSDDDGATWQSAGDPCLLIAAGHTDVLVTSTMAADGTVVLDCDQRGAGSATPLGRTITTTDGGATFHPPTDGGRLGPASLLAAASPSVQLVVPSGTGTLYRSTDAGNSWQPVAGLPTTGYTFLGFESDRVARLVSADGSTIWTTYDAGRTWTRASL